MEKLTNKKKFALGAASVLVFALVVGVNVGSANGGNLLNRLLDKLADRLTPSLEQQLLQDTQVEEELGSTGESLAVRNLTGLFDLTLKDSDGSDGGTRLSSRFISDTLFTAASTTFVSIQNTSGQTAYACRAGLRLFASSSNALPTAARWSIGTSTETGPASTTAFAGGTDNKSILGYSLASGTLSGQVGRFALNAAGDNGGNADGNTVTSTNAIGATAGTQVCVPVEHGVYVTGLFRQEVPVGTFSAGVSGYASSSYYWLELLSVPTST